MMSLRARVPRLKAVVAAGIYAFPEKGQTFPEPDDSDRVLAECRDGLERLLFPQPENRPEGFVSSDDEEMSAGDSGDAFLED